MREFFDFDATALKSDNIISSLTSDIPAALARRKEDEFRMALDEALPPGWALADVKRRCQLVRYAGSPIETLHLDGKPILELHPVEFETVQTETGWTMRATQKYRKLTV